MAVIGELATLVSAKTNPFERGMKRVRGDTRKTAGLIDSSKTAVLGFIGAFAGIGSVSLAVSRLKEEFSELDEVAKSAARLGTTTEAISRLQFAAELTGAGAGKLSAGLDVMAKRLGEASRGTGAARKALDELGLTAQELIRLDPAAAFGVIADRISELDTQSQKAAATANIFSRANQGLVNTLDLGSEGLQQMAEESDRFGNTVDSSVVGQIEEANDAMTRMSAGFGAFKRTLAIEVAPTVENVTGLIGELNAVMRDVSQQANDTGDSFGVWESTGAGFFITELGDQMEMVNLALRAMRADLAGNTEEADRLINEINKLSGFGELFGTIVNDAQENLAAPIGAFGMGVALESGIEAAAELQRRINEAKQEVEGILDNPPEGDPFARIGAMEPPDPFSDIEPPDVSFDDTDLDFAFDQFQSRIDRAGQGAELSVSSLDDALREIGGSADRFGVSFGDAFDAVGNVVGQGLDPTSLTGAFDDLNKAIADGVDPQLLANRFDEFLEKIASDDDLSLFELNDAVSQFRRSIGDAERPEPAAEIGAAARGSVEAAKILAQVRSSSMEDKRRKLDEDRNRKLDSILAAVADPETTFARIEDLT